MQPFEDHFWSVNLYSVSILFVISFRRIELLCKINIRLLSHKIIYKGGAREVWAPHFFLFFYYMVAAEVRFHFTKQKDGVRGVKSQM